MLRGSVIVGRNSVCKRAQDCKCCMNLGRDWHGEGGNERRKEGGRRVVKRSRSVSSGALMQREWPFSTLTQRIHPQRAA